ncbi:MAG: PEP-CTERM sorting domain-containing protein [Nitrospirae bacterium]|nr:PEP-CTERM sorting domain-containing protein [Nitrospirota bacterium]
MKNNKHISLTIAVAIMSIFLISSVAGAAQSANLTYLEMALPGGWYQYDYTAANTSTNGAKLWTFNFWFSEAATFTWLNVPTGWSTDHPFLSGYEETSTDPYTLANAVLPGNSLSGFRFKSDYQLGDMPFEAYFITTSGGLSSSSGMTSGTSVPVVPEPISSILFLSGGATLAVKRLRKRLNA